MYKENALRWKDVKAGQFGNMIRKFCGMVMGRTMPFCRIGNFVYILYLMSG